MATPSETQPIVEPPAREATISDLIATAFSRYGGGFVTYGVAVVLLCAIPGLAVVIARSQHARFAVFAAVLALLRVARVHAARGPDRRGRRSARATPASADRR